MASVMVVSDPYDATVTTSEATSHDLLEGDLQRTTLGRGQFRHCVQHAGGTAGVNHSWGGWFRTAQRVLERHRDQSVRTAAAVFGREQQVYAESLEVIEVEQVTSVARAVKQRQRCVAGP